MVGLALGSALMHSKASLIMVATSLAVSRQGYGSRGSNIFFEIMGSFSSKDPWDDVDEEEDTKESTDELEVGAIRWPG